MARPKTQNPCPIRLQKSTTPRKIHRTRTLLPPHHETRRRLPLTRTTNHRLPKIRASAAIPQRRIHRPLHHPHPLPPSRTFHPPKPRDCNPWAIKCACLQNPRPPPPHWHRQKRIRSSPQQNRPPPQIRHLGSQRKKQTHPRPNTSSPRGSLHPRPRQTRRHRMVPLEKSVELQPPKSLGIAIPRQFTSHASPPPQPHTYPQKPMNQIHGSPPPLHQKKSQLSTCTILFLYVLC